ncbi:type II toxin-antitoxin system YoeB family toxin [Streptomyces sp. tea 10]|nr:type II toxin-antitoxin system YoeB family toxin [Streptomyces sp. tea 10]
MIRASVPALSGRRTRPLTPGCTGGRGAWSRRITAEHRLVYMVVGDDLIILQARYHY